MAFEVICLRFVGAKVSLEWSAELFYSSSLDLEGMLMTCIRLVVSALG